MVLKIVVLPFFEGEGGRGGLDHAFFLYSSCCSCVCVGGGDGEQLSTSIRLGRRGTEGTTLM